jgi:hypothetical protein
LPFYGRIHIDIVLKEVVMDYGEAFTFVTKDTDWVKKLAIASALVLFSPILGITMLPLLGWSIEIAKRVIDNRDDVLPDWTDFGGFFAGGLKAIGIYLIWFLPVILAAVLSSGSSLLIDTDFGRSEAGQILLLVCSGCLLLFIVIYAIAAGVLLIPAYGVLAATGSFKDALNPSKALQVLKANPAGTIITLLIVAIVPGLASSLGSLVCLVGMLPAVAYTMAMTGHLYGQVYREANVAAV